MAQSLLATDGYKFSMAEAGWPLRTETFYYSLLGRERRWRRASLLNSCVPRLVLGSPRWKYSCQRATHDALAERLERGPAITELRGVPAHEFVYAVIDGAEEPAPAV